MIESAKKWIIQRPNTELVEKLQQNLGISAIAAKILAARGCETEEQAKALLTIDEQQLYDPYQMHGMTEAVARIQQAIEKKEKIVVYGDYDSDGITSTAVMLHVLRDLGADVDFMIPNRFTHGYGPHEELFRSAHANGVQLIITVDNGISGVEPLRIAKELGMDVIVTDHHEAGETLPIADVILHPRVPEGRYPFGELAGVGVAFKLAHALYGKVPKHLFEYVAIGTIADLVPLRDENRYLVKRGIEALRTSSSPWVKAICDASGVKQPDITEESIGFYFGPRLNAIGRLGDAMPGVDFLMSASSQEAQPLAKILNEKNEERKAIVNTITEQAVEMIESNAAIRDSLVLVVGGEGWNAGVVGIVASRLVGKYYKPTIVLSLDKEKGTAKGSARSIEGFHLYNELAKNKELIPHFGGHPMAAGMTFPLEHVDELRQRLHEQAAACLTEEQLIPKLAIDVPIDLSEVTVQAIEEIRKLGPFGTEFAKPVFTLEQVNVASMRRIGTQENHLKMELEDAYGKIDAIGFSKGYLYNEISYGVSISLAGDLQINEWQNIKKPQFMIEDIQATQWQLYDFRGKSQAANWLAKIPVEKCDFVAFQPSTVLQFERLVNRPVYLIESASDYEKIGDYVVFLDLPEDVSLLENLLESRSFKRIYAHFHTSNTQFFNGMPTRQHFSWYYGFLKKRPAFRIAAHVEQLAQHIGLNVDVINFMTKVFFELGFVTIDNGLTTTVNNPPKRELAEAPAYKMREAQIELEQKLLYATYTELKQWFHERMQGTP